MSDQKPFVNRRGRQVLTEEVLGTIKLDDAPDEVITPTHVQAAARHKRPRSRLRRWQKVTFVFVLLLLMMAPFLIGEYVRADYEASVRNTTVRVREIATKASETKEPNSQNLHATAASINEVRDGMCRGGFFDNLASLYPRASEAFKNCTVTREKIVTIARELATLQQQKAYLEELGQIITPLIPSSNEQFANMVAEQENWKMATEHLKQLSVPTSFRAVHEKTLTIATSLSDNWIRLVQANSAEDASAFQAAEAELAKQYELFRTITGEYNAVVTETQSALTAAYQRL